jgi:hypothetical protein
MIKTIRRFDDQEAISFQSFEDNFERASAAICGKRTAAVAEGATELL